jgi:tetratricopeptide (TPR) repeat protein
LELWRTRLLQAAELFERYEQSTDQPALDEAVVRYEEALAVVPGGIDRLLVMNDLGIAHRHRFERARDASGLERAISLHQECLSLASDIARVVRQQAALEGPSTEGVTAEEIEEMLLRLQSSALNNLGFDLRLRYQSEGVLLDLNRAIDLLGRALELAPDDAESVNPRNNLSAALLDRYRLERNVADLDRAVDLLARPAPAGEPGQVAWRHTNYGQALYQRYRRSDDPVDLDAAVAEFEAAAAAVAGGSPHESIMLNNYGVSLVTRFVHSRNERDLVTAVQILQKALLSQERGGPYRAGLLANLALAYSALSGFRSYRGARERALRAYRQATTSALQHLPVVAMSAASNWGVWASGNEDWPQAAEAYSYILEGMHQLFAGQGTRQDKESWLRTAERAAARAAVAQARTGDLPTAALSLESGRALLLSEALDLRDAELAELDASGHAAIRLSYETAMRRWLELSTVATEAIQTAGWSPGLARAAPLP